MKNLFMTVLLCIAAISQIDAQNSNTQPTEEDYERLIRASANMEFREYAIKTLNLTSEQIEKFDPLYREYMRDKSKLAKKKFDLLDDYVDEIKEDDSAKNEEDDKGDFLENYWEVEIAEMELKKDYFDRMEDKIGVDNAFGFFMLEENAQNKVQKEVIERRYVPIYIEVEKKNGASGSTGNNSRGMSNTDTKGISNSNNSMKSKPMDKKHKADIDAFSTWVKNGKNNNNKVDLSHNYTHDGLNSLVKAITALSTASNVDMSSFSQKKKEILDYADKLQEDRYSTKHADYARAAFTRAAEMLSAIQQKGDFKASNSSYTVSQVEAAAKKIDPSVLMTPQAEHIYSFFQKASEAINTMSNSISLASQ